tara:strand:+ start:46 stop:624 length:579 start_codon:yes stop_codon:yes gene_type:complete
MKINEILDKIYETCPYKKEYRNITYFDKKIHGSGTYGEVTKNGTDAIVKQFRGSFDKDCVFYDLGSGLGKMNLHIGLQYGVKKSIGIELSRERHRAAIENKEKFCPNNDKIEFHCKSFLDHDLSDATVVYMDNTCYPHEINEKIYNKLSKGCLLLYKKGFTRDFLNGRKQNKIKNLVERTYRQSGLIWIIVE